MRASLHPTRPLENQFQSELYLPRRGSRVCDQACRRAGGSIGKDRTFGRAEIRVIEKIEELGAKLQIHPLGYGSVLHDRHIDIGQSGTLVGSSAEISVGSGRGHAEGMRVEPPIRILKYNGPRERRIQIRPVWISRISIAGPICADQGREREAAQKSTDSVELPPSDEFVFEATCASEPAFAAPDREIVMGRYARLMSHV